MRNFKSNRMFLMTTALTFLALAALISGCSIFRAQLPEVVVVEAPGTTQVAAPGSDRHFIQPDDYFIMEESLLNNPWVYAAIGKLKQTASLQTDNQARFLRMLDGADIWTRHYVKTRIANQDELVLAKEVIFLDVQDSNGNYRSPDSNQEARTSWWLMGKIVDTSEMFKGFVMVSGGLRVNLNAIRVVTN